MVAEHLLTHGCRTFPNSMYARIRQFVKLNLATELLDGNAHAAVLLECVEVAVVLVQQVRVNQDAINDGCSREAISMAVTPRSIKWKYIDTEITNFRRA